MNDNKKKLEELKMEISNYSKETEMKLKGKIEELERTSEVQKYRNLSMQYKYFRQRTDKYTDDYIYLPPEQAQNKESMQKLVLEYCEKSCLVLQQMKQMEQLSTIMEYKLVNMFFSRIQEMPINNLSTSVQTFHSNEEHAHKDSCVEQPAVKKIGSRAS